MKNSGYTARVTEHNTRRPMPPRTVNISRDWSWMAPWIWPSMEWSITHNRHKRSAIHWLLHCQLVMTTRPASNKWVQMRSMPTINWHPNWAKVPISFRFPLPEGGFDKRIYTLSNLEYVAASQMYGESDRMMFTRALAAYTSNADIIPLARLLYIDLSVDPQTSKWFPIHLIRTRFFMVSNVRIMDTLVLLLMKKQKIICSAADPFEFLHPSPRFHHLWRFALCLLAERDHWSHSPCLFVCRRNSDSRVGCNRRPCNSSQSRHQCLSASGGWLPHYNGRRSSRHVWIWERMPGCTGDRFPREWCCPGTSAKRSAMGLLPTRMCLSHRARQNHSRNPSEIFSPSKQRFIIYPSSFTGMDSRRPQLAARMEAFSISEINNAGTRYNFGLDGCEFIANFSMTGKGSYNTDNDRFVLDVKTTGRWTCNLKYVRLGERSTSPANATENPSVKTTTTRIRKSIRRQLWNSQKKISEWKSPATIQEIFRRVLESKSPDFKQSLGDFDSIIQV